MAKICPQNMLSEPGYDLLFFVLCLAGMLGIASCISKTAFICQIAWWPEKRHSRNRFRKMSALFARQNAKKAWRLRACDAFSQAMIIRARRNVQFYAKML